MKPRWEYYKPGDVIAGVEILEVAWRAATQSATKYEVRYPCCGTEAEATHYYLNERLRFNYKRCRHCSPRPGRKQRRHLEPSADFSSAPSWAVPASLR